MKKLLSVYILLVLGIFVASAQSDTIFTHETVIPCDITEITGSAVKFKYPGEGHDNSLSINVIRKVVFKSGRVQEFAARSGFRRLSSPYDWEQVTMSNVESEVQGLYKVDDVSSKAKGTTEFSNQERVKRRAIDKIKMQAAIMGANIVYMLQMRSDGNKVDWLSGFSSSSETSLLGVAYSTQIPNFDAFKQVLGNKNLLSVPESLSLSNSDANYTKKPLSGTTLTIDKVYQEHGLIMIEGNIKGSKSDSFRVTYFDDSAFYIAYKARSGVYSYKILLK